jgi:hypothetical protein
MTNHSSYSIFAIAFWLLCANAAWGQINQNDSRNVLWVKGASPTSHGWSGMKIEMASQGFKYTDLMNSFYTPENGVLDAKNQINAMAGDGDEILGIAHDFGGIALRYAQLENQNITAMILCGVPNQGSLAILNSIIADGDGALTKSQRIAEVIEAIKTDDDCEDCNVTGLFKSWIDEIAGGSDFYRDIANGSPFINEINQAANLPTVPYLVLYGTVEDFSLTRMLSSRGFPHSDSDALVQCYEQRLREARGNAHVDYAHAAVGNTLGFLNGLRAFVKGLGNLNVGQILGAASDFILERRQQILNQIQAVRERNQELARITRCRLANDMLEAEWMLTMLDGAYDEVEVPIYMDNTLEWLACVSSCDVWLEPMPQANPECFEACGEPVVATMVTTTVFVIQPTDGLLSAAEQQLAGPHLAADPLHLINTNHFQETSRTKAEVTQALEDIFRGAAGAAFAIPYD